MLNEKKIRIFPINFVNLTLFSDKTMLDRNKWIFLSPRSLKVSDCWGTQCDAGFQQRHGSSSPAAMWAHRGQAAALGRKVWGRGKCGGQCHVPEPRGCVILLLNRGPECKTSSSSPNLIEWCPTCTLTMLDRLVLEYSLRTWGGEGGVLSQRREEIVAVFK